MRRIALITGATSAIGAAAARRFARSGYAVALAARRLPHLERLAAEIESEGATALPIATDICDPPAVEAMLRRIVDELGGLDAAFNNAGGGTPPMPLAEISPDAFGAALAVNLFGTYLCLRAEIGAMLVRGGGAIVNMSSTAGLQGVAGLSPYCAGKHGVIGMSKAAALDYAASKITINVVAPGPIATERIPEGQRERIGRFVPLQRIGDPEEVADLVYWLCSSQSQFITGTVVPIDGGRLAGTPSFAAAG